MARTVNRPSGLPTSINVKDPQALQHAMDRILEQLQIMNGERGNSDLRAVTRGELNDSALKDPTK